VSLSPAEFVVQRIGPNVAAPYQLNILAQLETKRKVAVRGPHGLGKTALAAWAVLWGLSCFPDDFKIITTAGAWRQLINYLWPEIHKWVGKVDWVQGAPEFLSMSAKRHGGEAFAVAAKDPALLEGAHAGKILYVLDEAKAIPAGIFDAIEGAFSTGDCYALAISTPGKPEGRFYDIHNRKPGFEDWTPIHVSLEDAIASGRIKREWAEQRKLQWGENSPTYQNRVLGEFCSDAIDSVIPLSWIELANERWQDWAQAGFPGQLTALGVDVGGEGDFSEMARIFDFLKVKEIDEFTKGDPNVATMETAGRVAGALYDHSAKAYIDSIGIGAGVLHRLNEMRLPAFGFTASRGTKLRDRSGELGFLNWRACGWWVLRELLDPQVKSSLCLPSDDDALLGELVSPTYQVLSNGRIKIEEKREIKKRLGRSTDKADAIIHGVIGPILWQEVESGDVSRLDYQGDDELYRIGDY